MQIMVDARDHVTSMIFMLSQGADPNQLLLKLAIEEYEQKLLDNMIIILC